MVYLSREAKFALSSGAPGLSERPPGYSQSRSRPSKSCSFTMATVLAMNVALLSAVFDISEY